MGGSGTTQTSNQVSQVQLPPWVNTAAQQNYAYAQNVANIPLQQYQGQMVAGVAPQQAQSWQTAANAQGAGLPQYGAAQAGYMGVLGQGAPQIQAGSLANTNLQPYMNPYTQSVINNTLPIMQQNLGVQQAGNQAAATAANAFGGSRLGVQQGVTQAQGAMNMAQMAAQLNQANFGQAQGAAQSDINTQLQAAQANQNAALQQGNLALSAAGGLSNLGNLANTNALQQYMMQSGAGQAEQTQAQNQINAQMQKFNQAFQYPGQQLGVLQSALGMTPYGQTQTTSGTTNTQTSSDPMMAALGIGQIFGNLFTGSDREMKTDIRKEGDHGGLPIYSYRYKGDPKSYPKVVGPMAQDLKKVAPDLVGSLGGRKVIGLGAGALHKPHIRKPRGMPAGAFSLA